MFLQYNRFYKSMCLATCSIKKRLIPAISFEGFIVNIIFLYTITPGNRKIEFINIIMLQISIKTYFMLCNKQCQPFMQTPTNTALLQLVYRDKSRGSCSNLSYPSGGCTCLIQFTSLDFTTECRHNNSIVGQCIIMALLQMNGMETYQYLQLHIVLSIFL